MKKKLFIDTWGWVVIHNRQEPRHTEVKAFYRKFRLQMGMIYTTDYILDETLNAFFDFSDRFAIIIYRKPTPWPKGGLKASK